jgi:hypothetical protein
MGKGNNNLSIVILVRSSKEQGTLYVNILIATLGCKLRIDEPLETGAAR